jgi:hypothetical protein
MHCINLGLPSVILRLIAGRTTKTTSGGSCPTGPLERVDHRVHAVLMTGERDADALVRLEWLGRAVRATLGTGAVHVVGRARSWLRPRPARRTSRSRSVPRRASPARTGTCGSTSLNPRDMRRLTDRATAATVFVSRRVIWLVFRSAIWRARLSQPVPLAEIPHRYSHGPFGLKTTTCHRAGKMSLPRVKIDP